MHVPTCRPQRLQHKYNRNSPIGACRRQFALRAFTIIEALIVAAVIGVVGAVSYVTVSDTARTAEELKLRSDVRAINRAISIYRSNGGDVSDIENPSEMLVRLKSAMSTADAAAQPGLTSAMLDTRIIAVLQTNEEAAQEGSLRAHWNAESRRFDIADSGAPGIKRFSIDDGEILTDFETDQRNAFLKFAVTDDWIWRYSDRPSSGRVEPTPHFQGSDWTTEISIDPVRNPDDPGVPTDPPPTGEDPDDPSDPDDPDGPTILAHPIISPPSGEYPLGQFPIEVTMTDPNPEGSSRIYYSIDGRHLQPYNGSFTVGPETPISAFAASQDHENYLNSVAVHAFYTVVLDIFAGQADGNWENGRRDDSGTPRISYSVENGYSIFRWGRPVSGTPPNSLSFQGSTIVGAEPEQLFPLGDLRYFNGSVYSGSEAHEVTLSVDLVLTTPETTTVSVPYVFELENTVNRGNSADEDADYVRIKDRSSPIPFELNGTDYYLVLQFGDVNDNGFTTVNQFHVHEGKSASTRLFGYFTPNPPE